MSSVPTKTDDRVLYSGAETSSEEECEPDLNSFEDGVDTESDLGSENSENSESEEEVEHKGVDPQLGLKWNSSGEKNLRGLWGMGSKRTTRRKNQHQRELREAAKSTHSIKSIFQRQIEIGTPTLKTGAKRKRDMETETHRTIGYQENVQLARHTASTDLNDLLRLKTEQKRKYGCFLSSKPNFLRRHLLVQAFFNLQALKLEKPSKFLKKTQRDLATMVAYTYGAHGGTARSIEKWEKTWIEDRTIPETQAGKHKHTFSWMDDEELIFETQCYIKTQGDSK